MEIKRDTLAVGGLIFDEHGSKVEPEQQPVVRTLEAQAAVDGTGGTQLGVIPGRIQSVQAAGVFAQDLRRKCVGCAHFDRRGFAALRKKMTATLDGHRQLNELRASLLESGNASVASLHETEDGDLDVEGALSMMGLCRAFGELVRDDVAVHPLANCPEGHDLFQPRDNAADKAGAAAYDHIMQLAQGSGEE